LRKKIAVIGGGISGLSVAWYLANYGYEVSIFEKTNQFGGWINARSSKDFFFEKGPRSFSTVRSPNLLSLINELNLSLDIIYSGNDAKDRYLYLDKKLQKIPNSPLSFLFSKLTRKHLLTLFKELFKQKNSLEDETIFSFIKRRFNKEIALTFFDPITTGIYGGDIHLLSVKSCFSKLYELEQNYGSIIKGLAYQNRPKKKNNLGPLFTLKKGMSQLTYKISAHENIYPSLSTQIEKIIQKNDKVILYTEGIKLEYDFAIAATPFMALKQLFPDIPLEMNSIPYNNLTTINVGMNEPNLLVKGFGYLVPRMEGEKLLGVIFDSNIFEEQNKESQTRLTLMVEGVLSNKNLPNFVEDILKRHLNITKKPDYISPYICRRAIPQYHVGHKEKILLISKYFKKRFSKILITGNYLENVSVNGCINKSKQIANKVETKIKL